MFQSLGHRADALAMAGRSTYEERGSYVIQRTEAEPTFWFGNKLIYREMVYGNVGSLKCEFEGEFPDATHVTFGFDIPGFSLEGWDIDGVTRVDVDVMARTGAAPPVPLPPGLEIRRISTLGDWDKVIALQHAVGVPPGDTGDHLPFVQQRFEAISDRCRGPGFAWFGVFDADLLVADMGVVWNAKLVRYQYVETRPSHRGRGICAALLSHVSAFAAFQARRAQQVIFADHGAASGRIYRRAGFQPVERMISLYRPGY